IKYRKPTVLVDPLLVAFSKTVRNVGTKNVRFVPYWAVAGFAEFLGVLACSRKYVSDKDDVLR
ncbi:MAG: hypothetical protein ABSF00_13175, partial [Candidatus Bathyarchaeia archaeon]